jgi:hypothetical protein
MLLSKGCGGGGHHGRRRLAVVVSMGGGGRRFSRRASLEAQMCCPRSSSEHCSEHLRADYGALPRCRSCSWFVAPPHRRRCFFSRGLGMGVLMALAEGRRNRGVGDGGCSGRHSRRRPSPVRSSPAPMDRRAHEEGSRRGAGIYGRRWERKAMRII